MCCDQPSHQLSPLSTKQMHLQPEMVQIHLFALRCNLLFGQPARLPSWLSNRPQLPHSSREARCGISCLVPFSLQFCKQLTKSASVENFFMGRYINLRLQLLLGCHYCFAFIRTYMQYNTKNYLNDDERTGD